MPHPLGLWPVFLLYLGEETAFSLKGIRCNGFDPCPAFSSTFWMKTSLFGRNQQSKGESAPFLEDTARLLLNLHIFGLLLSQSLFKCSRTLSRQREGTCSPCHSAPQQDNGLKAGDSGKWVTFLAQVVTGALGTLCSEDAPGNPAWISNVKCVSFAPPPAGCEDVEETWVAVRATGTYHVAL